MLTPALALALAAAPVAETWGLATSAGRIGTLKAVTQGRAVTVDWRVDDNGRGPKVTEAITLDARGLVQRRDIQGRGDSGAPVKESFWLEGQKARWQSLGDRGEAPAAGALYLDAGGSPWGLVHAFKVLLATRGLSRPALPSGSLRLQRLREAPVGAPGRAERLTAYALWGQGLGPTLLLGRGDHLVAVLQPGWVLAEERLLADFEALSALAEQLTGEVLGELARRLTHRVEGPLWLTNARVFDAAAGKVLPTPTSVVVFRGRITGVRDDPPPPGAAVVDCGGGTLLPGLFDAHAHLDAGAGLLHLAAGVTFVRDPGNDTRVLLGLERAFDQGTLLGPRVWKSGFLEGESPFASRGDFVVASLPQALDRVRWYADHGYWGVKLYNSMNPELVRPVAAEAHRLGLHVSGHVPAFMTAERALREGYDEITHLNQLLLGLLLTPQEDTRTIFRFTAIGERAGTLDLRGQPFRALVTLLKARQATLDPTLAVTSAVLRARDGRPSPLDSGWLEHVPAPVRRSRASALLDVKPEQEPAYERAWSKLEAVLLALDQEGIALVPGTDDLAGLTLHAELEGWVKAGLAPGRVLQAATLGGARLLGAEAQLGTIAVGKRADLYLVEGDPTADISAIRRGRLVLKGEAVLFPDELYQALEVKPFASHPPVPGVEAARSWVLPASTR